MAVKGKGIFLLFNHSVLSFHLVAEHAVQHPVLFASISHKMRPQNGEDEDIPLFETRAARGRAAYRVFSSTILVGIVLIWFHRLTHFPGIVEPGRYSWAAMALSELVLGLYWILTQAARWNVVYRYPFKDRLLTRYKEHEFPGIDIFVCTADPTLEPPALVINTVLSVMSYNYPSEKLCIYLSDDGCSQITFYALLEASKFASVWIPFCKKYNVEPRAPEIYFAREADTLEPNFAQERKCIKKSYEDMKCRIDSAAKTGLVAKEIRNEHKGFMEWNSSMNKGDHHTIVQILIDEQTTLSTDVEGNKLPTLVYLSREKRPGQAHNFKAGAMNSLIRVSSEISNAPIILNLDCDMYSNDPDAIKDALCFFLDEKQGQSISYVQYPQQFSNVTENDVYSNASGVPFQIELPGIDGFGGALYIGTGCFHRRESLSGTEYNTHHRLQSKSAPDNRTGNHKTVEELEEAAKRLANSSYETGTLWGKEIGLVYGFPVEDIVTGLTIQCRGWKPVYYSPRKNAFEGIAPVTLDIALVQYKRWSEGMFQIFCSKFCPFIYGRGKIKVGAQMGYCMYLLWAPISLPTLCYASIPTICLLHDVPLFPRLSSIWFAPFAYVFTARTACSLAESLICGDSLLKWWNSQRIWLFRCTTSYLFGLLDTIYKRLGLSETSFVITNKAVDDEVQNTYEKEIIEFGSSSVMFVIIAALALLNLLGLLYGIKKMVFSGGDEEALVKFAVQIALSGLIVALNLPVYEALFLRRDGGKFPSTVLIKAIGIASVACLIPL